MAPGWPKHMKKALSITASDDKMLVETSYLDLL